jgi:hypothetical protein
MSVIPLRKGATQQFYSSISRYLFPNVTRILLVVKDKLYVKDLVSSLITRGLHPLELYNIDLHQEMIGWRLFNMMAIRGLTLAITTKIGALGPYALTNGMVIIALEDKDDYLTSSDKTFVNTWIDNLDELGYVIESRIYSGFGFSKTIVRDSSEIYEGEQFAAVIRYSCILRARAQNKTYVALGAGVKEVLTLAKYGVQSRCYGYTQDLTIDLGTLVDEKPIMKQYTGPGDPLEPIQLLSYVGHGAKTICYIGNKPPLHPSSVLKLVAFSSYPKEDFCLVINRGEDDYGNPEFTTSSEKYNTIISSDLELIHQISKSRRCKRAIMFAPIRSVFSRPIIKGLRGNVFFLPYRPYTSTKVAIVLGDGYNDKPFDISLSTLAIKVRMFNRRRYDDVSFDTEARDIIAWSVIQNKDILKVRIDRRDYPCALFSISNINNPFPAAVSYMKKIAKRQQCVFLLPNSQMSKYTIPEHEFKGSKMVTDFGTKSYEDYTYDPLRLNNEGLSVMDLPKFIAHSLCRTDFSHNWEMVKYVPVANPSSRISWIWFVAGNFGLRDSKIQTIENSQTERMLLIAPLLRSALGFDSNAVYRVRSFVANERLKGIELLSSSKGTYMKDGKVFSVTGHGINMFITASLFPIDLRRWFNVIVGNLAINAGDNKLKQVVLDMLKKNLIAESDSATDKWHVAEDFDDLIKTSEIFLKIIDQPALEQTIAYKLGVERIKEFKGKIQPDSVDDLALVTL